MEDRRIPEEKSERGTFPRLFLLILGGVIAAGRLSPNPEYRPPSPETLDIISKGDDLGRSFYGQPVPGAEPILFAPEVLTAGLGAHGRLSFSPDGREIFWSSGEKIYYSTYDGKSLSPAKIAPFVDSSRHDGPVFSPDGRTVYFMSMRGLPIEKDKPNGRIWGVERGAAGWGEPYLLSEKIDRVTAQISLTENGRLYFTRLVGGERTYFYSKLSARRLADPEPVRFAQNSGIQLDDLYIDPEERFLIASIVRSNRASFRMADLVICFKQDDGAWGEPRILNDTINTDRYERFPGLSPDGRFLFFIRSSEAGSFKGARFYWIASEKLGIPGLQPARHRRDEQVGGAELFFGQTPPGLEPVKFWPEVLAVGRCPHGQLAFSQDGTGVFWSAILPPGPEQTIYFSAFDGKAFSKPMIAPFAAVSGNGGPAFSADGTRLFFSAELPPSAGSSAKRMAICYVERSASGWTQPVPVESTVDDRMIKGQVSVARNGNIYFTGRVLSERVPGIFICRYSNSKYLAPEKLAGPLATLPLVLDPWVDPDEKFLLVSCPPQEGPPLRTDIGISFRQPDGSWGIPVRLGGAVNTEAFERFASLSQDGKYLFFIRSLSPQFVGDQAHFYWVDARILEGPQPKNNKELSGGASGENFTPKGRLVTEGRIFSVASHDFDNDGRPDVVVSDFLNPARILYNDAGLEFKKVVPLTSTAETATGGHGVALADFNGDGCLDLFLVYNGNPARLLFGDGRGGFMDSGRAIGKPGLFGTSVEVADVDRDGDLDVFVIYYQERARLYLNDGAGSFAVSDQTFYDGVAVGDLDGDGDADVVSLREKGQASVWLNEKGRFILQEQTVDVGEGIGHLDLIDTDADGDLDLFALGRTTKSALWENDGRGSFRKSAQEFNSGTRVAAGDIDLDGKEDLVVGFSVWLNKGSGRFEHVQTIGPGTPSALELVDIDGDGDLDLLGAGLDRATGKSDLLLFLNTVRRR